MVVNFLEYLNGLYKNSGTLGYTSDLSLALEMSSVSDDVIHT